MKATIQFRPEHLRAVSLCASTDETRYVINGVLIKRTGNHVRLVATDGRRLVIHQPADSWGFEATEDFQFIVPTSLIETLPSGSRVQWFLTWESSDESILIQGPNYSIRANAIAGNYPNYMQVVPNPIPTGFSSELPVSVNPEFLRDIVSMLWALDDNKAISLRYQQDGPVVFVCPRTTVVLMPLRSQTSEPTVIL